MKLKIILLFFVLAVATSGCSNPFDDKIVTLKSIYNKIQKINTFSYEIKDNLEVNGAQNLKIYVKNYNDPQRRKIKIVVPAQNGENYLIENNETGLNVIYSPATNIYVDSRDFGQIYFDAIEHDYYKFLKDYTLTGEESVNDLPAYIIEKEGDNGTEKLWLKCFKFPKTL